MKYTDTSNSINGQYLGESVGSKLADFLAPLDDGYDANRAVEHVGTIIQDGSDANKPSPLVISIEITTLPTKVAYTVGEQLDLTGMELSVVMSGGSTGTLDNITNDYVTGFDSSVADPEQVLTVKVDEGTATFNISIA